MVRWIQVGHDDLLHRSEGMSGVSNLTCTPTQQTCQARKSLAFGMCYRPLAEWWERGRAERSLGYEERWLKRDGEVAHGGAGKVRRLHEREGNPTVNVRDGPLRFERFGLDSRLVHHRTAPVCSGSAPYPVHRHRKEVEIDFEHGFVLAQTAPSYFVSVPSPSRQSPRVQRTFLSGQELRIARACFGFAQFLAHLYRPVQTQDPERSCRFRLTH